MKKKSRSPRNYPRIDKLIEWGVVEPGETLYAPDRKSNRKLLENGNVTDAQGNEQSLNAWLKSVLNYSSVNTYTNTFNEAGRSLQDLRREYIEKHDLDY